MAQKALGIVIGLVAGAAAFYVASRGVTTLFGGNVMKAKHVAEAPLESGWKKFHSSQSKFSMATPGKYIQIDPRGSDFQQVFDEASKLNPELRGVVQQVVANQDIKMFAVDPGSISTGFATNINVLVKTMPTGLVQTDRSLTEFRSGLQSTLPSSMHLIDCRFVELPEGTAIRTEMDMNINGATGPVNAKSLAYMLPDGKESYNITFSCNKKDFDKMRSSFEAMAKTFRLD